MLLHNRKAVSRERITRPLISSFLVITRITRRVTENVRRRSTRSDRRATRPVSERAVRTTCPYRVDGYNRRERNQDKRQPQADNRGPVFCQVFRAYFCYFDLSFVSLLRVTCVFP